MKIYTTIFLDIDNISFELYKHRHMHDYTINMIEQILKNGLKSLKKFEVIALLGKNENEGRRFLLKNRIEYMNQVSKEMLGFSGSNPSYFEYLLKHFDRNKHEVLVVSGNERTIKTAKTVGLDTCYFNIFNPNTDIQPNMNITKLEELTKYSYTKPVIKEKPVEITPNLTDYHYYIDLALIRILEEKNIALRNYTTDEEKFMESLQSDKPKLAITLDPALAKCLKSYKCITYFVNNHKNDSVDYVADYETSIENLPKQLEKLMKK